MKCAPSALMIGIVSMSSVLSRNRLETAQYAIVTTFLMLNLEGWHRQFSSSLSIVLWSRVAIDGP